MVAPYVPNSLSPLNVYIDRTQTYQFTWVFNDPDHGDSQSAFELNWSHDRGSTWEVVTQTTGNTYWNAGANLFPKQEIYWRVKVADQTSAWSGWSPQARFIAWEKPSAATITSPAQGSTVTVSRPTMTWTTPASQTMYQIQVKQGTTVVWDSGQVSSSTKSVQVGVDLQTNVTYAFNVRYYSSLWSDYASNSATVNYTPPDVPTITVTAQTGYMLVSITNPGPTAGKPTVSSNDVVRREHAGPGAWVTLITGVAKDGTYRDYTAVSGIAYDYYVVAHGSNDTVVQSSTLSNVTLTLTNVWLHDVTNPTGTAIQIAHVTKRSASWQPQAELIYYAGRDKPVVEYDSYAEDERLTIDILTTDGENIWSSIQSLVKSKHTLCYRDSTGRKLFCIILNLNPDELMWGAKTVTLELIAVDYHEAV